MRRVAGLAAMLLVLGSAACTVESGGSGTVPTGDDDEVVDLLRDRGRAAEAIADLDDAIGASPARLGDVSVYPEYLIVEAQDPTNTEHIDRYEWRDVGVAAPTPVQLSGPQEDIEASLFPSSAVAWDRLAAIVRRAEQATEEARPLRIEEAQASYVSVERSTLTEDDGRIIVRIQISGPRRSGYVTTTASGGIIEVYVG